MRSSKWTMALAILAAILGLVLGGCGGQQAKPAAAPTFDKLIVVADTVRGRDNVPDDQLGLKVCVQNSKWMRNERVVWRIKVMDPKTGAYLDDQALGQVEVKLADGQVLAAKYGPHPGKEPTDFFWTAGWTIPEDYPSGTHKFTVSAVGKDGRASQFLDFNVAAAQLTVLDAKVPVIAKK